MAGYRSGRGHVAGGALLLVAVMFLAQDAFLVPQRSEASLRASSNTKFGITGAGQARHVVSDTPLRQRQAAAQEAAQAPAWPLKRLHQVSALAGLLCIERLLRPLSKATPLPHALWGMFGTFGTLLLVRKFGGNDAANSIFGALEPGYRTLVKWGTCFFVPALMGLPVAVAANIELFSSPVVVVKMLVLIAGGYLGSLGATGFLAGKFESMFGKSGDSRTVIPEAARTAADAGVTGGKNAELAAKLQGDVNTLQEVLQELPADIREVLLTPDFASKCATRFSELDSDESGKLSAEELIPVIANLVGSDLNSAGVSANMIEEQASGCIAAFGNEETIDKKEFLKFAKYIVVSSYLGAGMTEECPVPAAPAKPAKKERPYDPSWLKVYGAGMGAAVALFLGKSAAVAGPCEAIFMLCAVLAGFVIGQNLPAPWPQRVNPMITCIAVGYTACAAWASLTGATFMQVLDVFKGPSGAGGMFLMPLLQPLLISLGLSLYERRKVLTEDYAVILCTTLGSAFFGLFFTAIFAGPVLQLPTLLVGSAVPRCVTAALAIAIAGMLGPLANVAFAIALVQVMGLIGAAQGLNIMRAWGFRSPLQRGLSMGATAAGLGTVAIARTDPEAFGYSAVSFALCGSFATMLVAIPPLRALLVKIILLGR